LSLQRAAGKITHMSGSRKPREIAPRVWVLNLDAESELDAVRSYSPTQHMRAIVERERARLLETLVAPGDVVLTEDDFSHTGAALRHAHGLSGLAWSPTPRALAQLRAAGAVLPEAPGLDTLRRVNARAFAAQVRAPWREASFDKHIVTSLEDLLARLAQPAPHGWLVRRTFGAAGRGRRRIAAGRPSSADSAWLAAGLSRGALVVEPWVEVLREYTRSAWLHADGELTISPPCLQRTTEHGAWSLTERAEVGAVSRADDAALEQMVAQAGAALAREGYFGPFGIDAYRHRALDGSARSVLNPLSEINARFTMDWATAMAQEPRDGEALERLDGFLQRSASNCTPRAGE
jgi:hypothetical protein